MFEVTFYGKKLMKRTLALALSLYFFMATLGFAGELAKGSAEIFNNNTQNAREQALNNALREAVKQGVGTIIDSETEVQNWEVIRDEVYSSAKGYVKKYKITRDERVGNAWYVEIDAEVASSDIQGKLADLRILHKKMGNKRVMVIYRAEHPRAVKRDHGSAISALANLQTSLNHQGFRVFDQKSVDLLYADGSASNEEWITIALNQQAEILFEYEVLSSGASQPGRMFQAAKSDVMVRVYDVSTGRLISNQVANQKQITNAHVGSFDWNQSLSKAGGKAAKAVAKKSIKDIVSYYEAVGDMGTSFFMRFSGLDEDQEDKVLEILEALPGYQSLTELKNDETLIEVEYFSNLSKSRLRRKLKLEAKQKRVPLKLILFAGNRFEYESN